MSPPGSVFGFARQTAPPLTHTGSPAPPPCSLCHSPLHTNPLVSPPPLPSMSSWNRGPRGSGFLVSHTKPPSHAHRPPAPPARSLSHPRHHISPPVSPLPLSCRSGRNWACRGSVFGFRTPNRPLSRVPASSPPQLAHSPIHGTGISPLSIPNPSLAGPAETEPLRAWFSVSRAPNRPPLLTRTGLQPPSSLTRPSTALHKPPVHP